MPHCAPLPPALPPASPAGYGRRPGRLWHWRGCRGHALRAARVGLEYHAWDGLLSSNTWVKIVVLLLSIKIPHAMSSAVPSCSDAHDFPRYPCLASNPNQRFIVLSVSATPFLFVCIAFPSHSTQFAIATHCATRF